MKYGIHVAYAVCVCTADRHVHASPALHELHTGLTTALALAMNFYVHACETGM